MKVIYPQGDFNTDLISAFKFSVAYRFIAGQVPSQEANIISSKRQHKNEF
jgi:hypothetical protein